MSELKTQRAIKYINELVVTKKGDTRQGGGEPTLLTTGREKNLASKKK